MADSNRAKRSVQPPTFHPGSGQYRKRIDGKAYYFGTDHDAALAKWLREKDNLLAGRTPKPFEGDSCDLKTLCNSFLTNAKAKREGGELRAMGIYYDAGRTADRPQSTSRNENVVPPHSGHLGRCDPISRSNCQHSCIGND